MGTNALVAMGQRKLDEARRALHDAVDDFSIPDGEVLELRKKIQRACEDQKKLERRSKGVLGFLGL